MVSDPIFYALVLLGLLWLCVMLYYAWPSDCPAGEQRTSKALKRLSRSPYWVWVAIEPVTKLLLTIDVGI
jgi:hypothetical protein